MHSIYQGQLQLSNVLATRQIFRLMLKTHQQPLGRRRPVMGLPCLPPWLQSKGRKQISIHRQPGPPSFLPSFLTHGFPVPPSLHRPRKELVRFWACHPSTAITDLSIRIFCCPLASTGAPLFLLSPVLSIVQALVRSHRSRR